MLGRNRRNAIVFLRVFCTAVSLIIVETSRPVLLGYHGTELSIFIPSFLSKLKLILTTSRGGTIHTTGILRWDTTRQ